jgi:hypothetical protein
MASNSFDWLLGDVLEILDRIRWSFGDWEIKRQRSTKERLAAFLLSYKLLLRFSDSHYLYFLERIFESDQ